MISEDLGIKELDKTEKRSNSLTRVVGKLIPGHDKYDQDDLDYYDGMRICHIDLNKICFVGELLEGKIEDKHYFYREIMFDNGYFMLVDDKYIDGILYQKE